MATKEPVDYTIALGLVIALLNEKSDNHRTTCALWETNPKEYGTEDYLNAERLAGSEDAPSRCYACGQYTIVNNVCGNCGKDSRAQFGDFRGPIRPLTFKGDNYEIESTIQIATAICEECGLAISSPDLPQGWSQIGESQFRGTIDGLASYCPGCTHRGQLRDAPDSPWCEPCRSYHPYPQTVEHWRELGCKADRRDFPAPQITCTRCREGNHKLCDRGDGQQCACPCPYFSQATTVEPPARVWIRPGDAEAAEICAEMAREATTIAARHASNFRESGSDTDADLKLRYEAMSEALREAQRRIESELAATSVETDAVFDEVTHRIDAVVDAAVTWRQSDEDWQSQADNLEAAIDSLLELRSPPVSLMTQQRYWKAEREAIRARLEAAPKGPYRDLAHPDYAGADHRITNNSNSDWSQFGHLATVSASAAPMFAHSWQDLRTLLAHADEDEREIERLTKLSKRIYGTIRGDVRAYHDDGDVGLCSKEPWVIEEESGQKWSCYDAQFVPDRECVASQTKFIKRQAEDHYAELSRQKRIEEGVRAELALRDQRISELTGELAVADDALDVQVVTIASLRKANEEVWDRAIATVPEVGVTFPEGYEEWIDAPSYREGVITALEAARQSTAKNSQIEPIGHSETTD